MRRRLFALSTALLAVTVLALAGAAVAGAAIHSLRVSVAPPGYQGPTKFVYMELAGLNPALSTQITVRRAGVATPIEDEFEFSGPDHFSTYDLEQLEPGDLIEIRQPSTAIAPTETFQTPSASLNIAGSTISGTIGGGPTNTLTVEGTCLSQASVVQLPAAGGAFNQTFPAGDVPAGVRVGLRSIDARGFDFELRGLAPGERPCVYIDSSSAQSLSRNPGAKDPTPFQLQVDNLSQAIPNTRIVLRRGGAILEDHSSATSTQLSISVATAARPGDQLEIYRPQTAGTPSQVLTIPQISGTFDTSVDLAAVDGPAARESRVFACTPQICEGSGRTLLDTPAGRNFFDFTKPVSYETALDLQADSLVEGTFQSATEPLEYRFQLSRGDLVAPVYSLKLPSVLKRKTLTKAFKKGYKVKLKSNEAGAAKLTLAFPKSKAGKAVTLAKASKGANVGTTTVAMKFTKAGKKALKKLRKRSSRLATLTSTVTDASGNVSTLVKRTKIKA